MPNFTTLSFPGAFTTVASGINNDGLIVGQYGAADGTFHGYVASVVLDTPEPASLSLFAVGLTALLAYRIPCFADLLKTSTLPIVAPQRRFKTHSFTVPVAAPAASHL
jgi:hypothetical protein